MLTFIYKLHSIHILSKYETLFFLLVMTKCYIFTYFVILLQKLLIIYLWLFSLPVIFHRQGKRKLSPEIMAAMQKKIDEEKKALEEKKDMVEEDRNTVHRELQRRESELHKAQWVNELYRGVMV